MLSHYLNSANPSRDGRNPSFSWNSIALSRSVGSLISYRTSLPGLSLSRVSVLLGLSLSLSLCLILFNLSAFLLFFSCFTSVVSYSLPPSFLPYLPSSTFFFHIFFVLSPFAFLFYMYLIVFLFACSLACTLFLQQRKNIDIQIGYVPIYITYCITHTHTHSHTLIHSHSYLRRVHHSALLICELLIPTCASEAHGPNLHWHCFRELKSKLVSHTLATLSGELRSRGYCMLSMYVCMHVFVCTPVCVYVHLYTFIYP